VDSVWTKKYLIPSFDWNNNAEEAKAVWEGFLWSPRLYHPLLLAMKPHLLDTVHQYQELGEYSKQYAAFLTYAALSQIDGYKIEDFQNAFNELPQKALKEVARTLCQAIASAEDQREKYWTNRIKPFLHDIWPKSQKIISDSIVKSFAQVIIETRNKFPEALAILLPWLRPIEDTHYIIHLLSESQLSDLFPNDSLKFMGTIIGERIWVTKEFEQCLNAIIKANPKLKRNSQYIRLNELMRKHG
jgi:hypothetical protein